MERLTMESDKGGVALNFDLDVTCEKSEMLKILKMAEKLKEYEDLEEQCTKENFLSLKALLKKWKEFFEDIQELYEYRKLKKQGKLLELPCAVGDTVWSNDFEETQNYIVTGFSFGELDDNDDDDCQTEEEIFKQVIVHFKNSDGSIAGSTPANNIGKAIFLTREEAEQALKGNE